MRSLDSTVAADIGRFPSGLCTTKHSTGDNLGFRLDSTFLSANCNDTDDGRPGWCREDEHLRERPPSWRMSGPHLKYSWRVSARN